MSQKALVCVLTMAEILSCSIDSGDISFLSGSINYFTECSNDISISDLSIPTEEPETSDSNFTGHGIEVDCGALNSLGLEWVESSDW